MLATGQRGSFKGRHFRSEVILRALHWYLAFPVSYRDLALMLSERDVTADHTTLFRWMQAKSMDKILQEAEDTIAGWANGS